MTVYLSMAESGGASLLDTCRINFSPKIQQQAHHCLMALGGSGN
jgi:hypothetical protein